jgi:hypothetical protein
MTHSYTLAITYLGYESDPEFLSVLLQAADRSAADARRIRFINDPLAPKTTTMAKVGKKESQWVNSSTTLTEVGAAEVRWSDQECNDLAKLASTSPIYIARQSSSTHCPTHTHTVCPDSGATSIMGPHWDMFSEYVDLCGKGLVFRLGDKDKTIPIFGRGTLSIAITATILHIWKPSTFPICW